jgi:hypothetical protein
MATIHYSDTPTEGDAVVTFDAGKLTKKNTSRYLSIS